VKKRLEKEAKKELKKSRRSKRSNSRSSSRSRSRRRRSMYTIPFQMFFVKAVIQFDWSKRDIFITFYSAVPILKMVPFLKCITELVARKFLKFLKFDIPLEARRKLNNSPFHLIIYAMQ
jgi:hypothetical protein